MTEYLERAVDRRSRFQRAERLEAQGRFAESVRLLSELVEEQPDDHAHVSLGIALTKLGDFPHAEQELRGPTIGAGQGAGPARDDPLLALWVGECAPFPSVRQVVTFHISPTEF